MIRRRYQQGGIANAPAVSPAYSTPGAAQGVTGLWDYGSSSSPTSSLSPSAGGTGVSGMWDYGSVSGLSGSTGGYGTPSATSPIQTMEGPQYRPRWQWNEPYTYKRSRGRGSKTLPGYWMAYENPGDEYGTRQPAGSKPPSDSYQLEGLEETEREIRRRLYGDEFHADWERDEYGNLREGGLVRRRYQGGGIASLLEGGMPGAVAGAGIPGGGITETFQEEISPVGAADPTMESNLTPEQSYLLKVFAEARDALMGEHPQPEVAISEFVEVFGSEALDKLRRELSAGGEEAGEFGETRGFGRGTESDGLSDSIAGNIDGQEEIAVGEGEVVIPAWAVAAAGNGSSDSGARRWMAMVDEMGDARGAPGQPTQVAGVGIEEIMRRRARA